MKKNMIRALVVALLGVAAVQALPPELIYYQGRLLDSDGHPVNASATIETRLYPDASGGSSLWEQTLNDVPVTDGLYGFHFGDSLLPAALTNAACWLELEVNGEVLTPRHRLISVPYALRAGAAGSLGTDYSGVPAGVVILWSGPVAGIPDGWVLCDGANGTPNLTERFVAGAAAANEVQTVVGTNSLVLTANQLPSHAHTGNLLAAGTHAHTASSANSTTHTHSGGGITSGNAHTHSITYGGYGNSLGTRGGGDFDSYTQFNVTIGTAANHTHSYSTQSTGAHTHTLTTPADGAHTHTVTLDSAGGGAAIDNRPAYYALAFIMKTE